jgi:sister-chromatid-cohesion protein PDS5
MDVDDLPDWMPEEELPPLARAKIRAIKICRHRCLVQAQSESALVTAKPVIKMLVTLIQNAGLITEDAHDQYVFA